MPGRRPMIAATLARAHARGCVPGERLATDGKKDVNKHVEKTMKDQDAALRRYLLWRIFEGSVAHSNEPNKEDVDEIAMSGARERWLAPGSTAPTHQEMKAFLRWHARLCNGKIVKQPTVDSVNCTAEHFFAGFTRVTGSATHDRSEVYNWVRKVLTVEGHVRQVKRPKHNFTKPTLDHVLDTLWMGDDQMYIHERSRLQFTFLLLLYTATGARIGAFFDGGGLRWKDFEIHLLRQPNNKWKPIYKIHQRHVKNNRSPDDISFQTAMRSHHLLRYDTTAFLLAFAIADGVLSGISSVDDLWSQRVGDEVQTLVLPINPAALDLPVLRQCTQRSGVAPNTTMPKSVFLTIFRSTLKNAGYSGSATIHSIRRGLGKQIDQLYTEAQRSQHLTQSDPRVFGQSYVANMSSCDGQAAFLGEAADHVHIEYFQSLEPFREPGLPCSIPAQQMRKLKQDPRITELDSRISRLRTDPTKHEACNIAKLDRQALWKKLKQEALSSYEGRWLAERRASKLKARGEPLESPSKHERVQCMHRIIPERGRLARQMTAAVEQGEEQLSSAIEDMITLCLRDARVIYLPHLQPRQGCCPIDKCHKPMESCRKKETRAQHILTCCRKDRAASLSRRISDVFYCRLCYEWVDDPASWTGHCERHLQNWTTKQCGAFVHCYTLIRPGLCPFCLGDECRPAPERLQAWARNDKLWEHVLEHTVGLTWPLQCPHPLCDNIFSVEESFFCHLMDIHFLSKLPDLGAASSGRTKRAAALLDEERTAPSSISSLPSLSLSSSLSPCPKRVAISHGDRPVAQPSVIALLSPTPSSNASVSSFDLSLPRPHLHDVETVRHGLTLQYDSAKNCPGAATEPEFDFSPFLRSPSPDPSHITLIQAASPEIQHARGQRASNTRIRLKCTTPKALSPKELAPILRAGNQEDASLEANHGHGQRLTKTRIRLKCTAPEALASKVALEANHGHGQRVATTRIRLKCTAPETLAP